MTLEMKSDAEVAKALEYIICISYVGGPDYLQRALASIGDKHLEKTYVINSSDPLSTQSKLTHSWCEYIPIVPLSHTQSHNYFQILAHGYDALIVMHNDAECEPDTIDKLLALKETLPRKWGVVFTNYDAVAMYNPAMWKDIGKWDWRLFPSYFSDDDYYRRAKLAGWELIDSGLPVRHEGSHIINKVDMKLKWLNHHILHESARNAYLRKWGGDPGQETFTVPFDGALDAPYPDK